jgi:tetratricopeptide (TPR) repeat protein
MRALQRRLHTSLGYKSYWFCYRHSDFDTLPDWLKVHQDVVFVLPPEAALPERPAPVQAIKAFAGESLEMESPIQLKPETIAESGGRLDVVEAHTVFDRLLKELKAEIPPLVRDPLDFFANRLEESVPPDNQISQGAAAYSFGSVIERIRSAQKCLDTVKGTAGNTREAEELLEEVRDATRRSLYEDALKTALRIASNDLEEIESRDLLESLAIATRNVDANSEQKLPGLDLVIQLVIALSKRSPDLQLDLVHADALNGKGRTLRVLNRSEEAIGAYDDLVRRFGDSPAAALQEWVAKALFNKGFALGTLNRCEEAIGVYDDLVRRFGDSPTAPLQVLVAKALINKGITLGTLNRNEEAVGVYDDLVRRFGNSPTAPLQDLVAKVLLNKGFRLKTLNRNEEAIGVYDDLVRRFGDSSAAALQEQVARALYNKGYTLGILNRSEEAIGVYDDLVRRFGDSSAVALQEHVAKALVNKGLALNRLARRREAAEVLNQVIQRFGSATEPDLLRIVAEARMRKQALGES